MKQFRFLLGLVALAAAAQVHAGCMDNLDRLLRQAAPGLQRTPERAASSHFVPAVYHPGDTPASLRPVGDWGEAANDSIVGLWQFKFDGFAADWGTQAWHSDGTELTFSGGQNPETGDVCQGVWRRVGQNTYTLNHIAMGWLAPGAGFGIRVHLHFVVKLDPSGNSFSGKYAAAVYLENSTDPFLESDANKLSSGTGGVTATRVLPD